MTPCEARKRESLEGTRNWEVWCGLALLALIVLTPSTMFAVMEVERRGRDAESGRVLFRINGPLGELTVTSR